MGQRRERAHEHQGREHPFPPQAEERGRARNLDLGSVVRQPEVFREMLASERGPCEFGSLPQVSDISADPLERNEVNWQSSVGNGGHLELGARPARLRQRGGLSVLAWNGCFS